MTSREQQNLAAPCGLYCGACSAYVARKRGDTERLEELAKYVAQYRGQELEMEDLACEGCLSAEVIALYCRECVLRACVFKRGLTHCAQCSDFPCQRITDFNNDGIRHHSEVLDNGRRQREIGIAAWIKEQEERWRWLSRSRQGDVSARRFGPSLLGITSLSWYYSALSASTIRDDVLESGLWSIHMSTEC